MSTCAYLADTQRLHMKLPNNFAYIAKKQRKKSINLSDVTLSENMLGEIE